MINLSNLGHCSLVLNRCLSKVSVCRRQALLWFESLSYIISFIACLTPINFWDRLVIMALVPPLLTILLLCVIWLPLKVQDLRDYSDDIQRREARIVVRRGT